MRYFPVAFTCILLCVFVNVGIAQLPIQPARTVSFTTNEGSYMNIDVSPDGKTLVFDLLGDLYTLPVTGGKATQITRGLALNLRPVWSPDGNKIAYISDYSGEFHINIRDVSGQNHLVLGKTEREVKYGSNLYWLPDGTGVVTGNSVYGLSGKTSLLKEGVRDPIRYAADGHSVYYLEGGKLNQLEYSKKLISTLTTVDRKVANTSVLSPDAQWLAFIKDTGRNKCLVVRDLKAGADRILVKALIKAENYEAAVPSMHYAFTPDSRSLFLSYGGKIHKVGIIDGRDDVVPFSADVKSDLGAYNYNTFRIKHDSVHVKYARSANVRPDGKQLVFSALNKLYVKDLPNGQPRLLLEQSCSQYQPVYSPDGKWVAYVSWSDTVGGFLWRVPFAGGDPERLTTVPGQYQRPIWSPDGSTIAVVKGEPVLKDRDDWGSGELLLLDITSGSIRVLDKGIPLWNRLSFSSDGGRVIYIPKLRISWDKPVEYLVSKSVSESSQKQIMALTDDVGFLQGCFSPDGRYLVYSIAEDLFLLRIDRQKDSVMMFSRTQKLPLIRFSAGVDPYWEPEGKMLSWTYGNRFFSINPDKIMAAAVGWKDSVQGDIKETFTTVAAVPDRIIDLKVTAPAHAGKGIVVLKNARIITMRGARVIENGTIVIKDNRISNVGLAADIITPVGATVFDLRGKTVMPGLIDLHLHMRIPADVFPQQSWMFLANLAYGVTTACDPSLNFDSYGYKELLETGQMMGPRLFTVGRAARVADGLIRCDRKEDATALVLKRAALGGTVVKQYTLRTRLQRQWLLAACKELGLNMTNEGAADPIVQWGMIKDGSTGVEHNPAWGDVYKDVLSFIASSNIYLTPAMQVCYGAESAKEYFKYKYWKLPNKKMVHFIKSDSLHKSPVGNGAESLEAILNAQPADTAAPAFLLPARADAAIRKMGGRVTLGSHGNNEGIGVHNELWALQMGGISNMQALQAATIMGAEALGVHKDIGSVEPGKIADLLILNKNPLEDIHYSREIKYVMKDGILYDGDTLDTIWPYKQQCPEWRLLKK